jgi:predicted nucleic acid-binding protein
VLVVDTSAVVAALVGRPPDGRLVDRLGTDGDLHAPHLLDVELLHALRRLVSTGGLSQERAADARADFAELTIVRYGHQPLADRAWELRDNLTADDAVFVALAEALAVPLVTCDARLGRAPGHRATVELFPGP